MTLCPRTSHLTASATVSVNRQPNAGDHEELVQYLQLAVALKRQFLKRYVKEQDSERLHGNKGMRASLLGGKTHRMKQKTGQRHKA